MSTQSLSCPACRFLLSSVMQRTLRCLRLNLSEVKSESFALQKGKLPVFFVYFTPLPDVSLVGPALILEQLTIFTLGAIVCAETRS